MAKTSRPTYSGARPVPNSGAMLAGMTLGPTVPELAPIASTPNSRTNVPMISVMRFEAVFRMAGAVEYTASLRPGSSVARQWLLYAAKTRQAPTKAPTSSPARYCGTSDQGVLPIVARPMVTAGLRCAPLNRPTAKMAIVTAMPQPNVMTIHPPFSALECARSTAATTPSPNRIRIAVPITSDPKMLNPDLPCVDGPRTLRVRGGRVNAQPARNRPPQQDLRESIYRNGAVLIEPSAGLHRRRLALGPREPRHLGGCRRGALEQRAHALHDLGL